MKKPLQLRIRVQDETSTEIAAKALVLGLLRRADHRGTDVRIDLQQPFRPDAWASDTNLPAKMALESHFEISVGKTRCTHQ